MSSRFACLALTCVFVLAACPAPRVNQGTPQFTVEVTVTHATATPAGTVKVNASATQAFTVVPAEGYTLSKTVGGTCPAGTWAGTVYTTGAVTADCTVSFSGTQNTYQVTPSGTNVTLDPSGVQTVGYGLTQSFTVTAAIGYTVSTTVGGTCPAGTWAGAVYTTGPVTANCTVIFDGTLEMLQVTPSGANVTIAPSGVQTVGYGSTPSFTVTPAADDTLTTTVGGTCPAGTWAGAVYTTGPITASCTVIFGATLDSYVVTPSGTNATFSPTGPQTVAAGSTASFSLTPASNDILSSTAGGTCPAGSWSGATYTTGAITASCTVTFTAGPIVLNPGTSQMLSVSWGQTTPTIAYSATANGVPLSVTWSLDRTDVASIAGGPSTGAAFTPTGASGGLVTLTASAGGATASAQILVTLVILQNGANTNPAEQAQIPAPSRPAEESAAWAAKAWGRPSATGLRSPRSGRPSRTVRRRASPICTRMIRRCGRSDCRRRCSCGPGRRWTPTPSRSR